MYTVFLVGHFNSPTRTPWSGFWVPDFVSIAYPREGGGRLGLLFILIVPFDFYPCSSSVAKSCLTFCTPVECSMPGFPVLPDISEFAQTHVHWVCDAIQPSHPLSPPSPPAFNLSQHQVILPWVDSVSGGRSTGASASASGLPKNTQDRSPLEWTSWISLQSKGLSRVFSNTTVQKHQIVYLFSIWENSLLETSEAICENLKKLWVQFL